jgi:hypothetical protein
VGNATAHNEELHNSCSSPNIVRGRNEMKGDETGGGLKGISNAKRICWSN